MAITFSIKNGSISLINEFNKRNIPPILNVYEKSAVSVISDLINSCGLDFSRSHVERRSDNYLSVVCDTGNDFCRIKAGPRSNWILLDLSSCDASIRDDKRLDHIKKRDIRHWKIPLESVDDLRNYADIICASYKQALSKHLFEATDL